MTPEDANHIALAAIRQVLAAAHDFQLNIVGKPVVVTVGTPMGNASHQDARLAR